MATPGEKLATSLEVLNQLEHRNVIRSSQISRVHRERLVQNGYLMEVAKGWYVITRPSINDGSSTPWFALYWTFISVYLNDRFGEDYCLSAESSLQLHTGSTIAPSQLVAIVKTKGTQQLKLPFETSLLIYSDHKNFPANRSTLNNLWVMSLPAALCKVAPAFFKQNPPTAELALRMVRDSSDILRILLESGSISAAARLVGAYRFLGFKQIAENIVRSMEASGYTIKETNPFNNPTSFLAAGKRIQSPYVGRIEFLWESMRDFVLDNFPAPPGIPTDHQKHLQEIEEIYSNDAYNSLSIEGYQVTPTLIEQVRNGTWNPDSSENDRLHKEALAAKGYNLAFKSVKESISKILTGSNPGEIVSNDHQLWYSQMFSPSVQAGILKPSELAGYRNQPVYIKGSQHVPLPYSSVLDCMESLFRLLSDEPHPGVRAILGHFLFVFIHPYMDGNGRIGRFLMNTMLASGGYPWTVVRMKHRKDYMDSLEAAAAKGNILDFTQFICKEMAAPHQGSETLSPLTKG